MIFKTARAMQIACLEEEQLKSIHEKELKIGRCLMPDEIQNFLGIDSIKKTLLIPEDDELQSLHRDRIERDIERLNFSEMTTGEGLVCSTNVERAHSFDWVVFRNKLKMAFEYSGKGSHGGKGVMVRLKKAQEDFFKNEQ